MLAEIVSPARMEAARLAIAWTRRSSCGRFVTQAPASTLFHYDGGWARLRSKAAWPIGRQRGWATAAGLRRRL